MSKIPKEIEDLTPQQLINQLNNLSVRDLQDIVRQINSYYYSKQAILRQLENGSNKPELDVSEQFAIESLNRWSYNTSEKSKLIIKIAQIHLLILAVHGRVLACSRY